MSDDSESLIHGYLDDALSTEQQESLAQRLKSDPAYARRFAQEALFHDQLRNTWIAWQQPPREEPSLAVARATRRWPSRWLAAASTLCVVLAAAALLWQTLRVSPVAAAIVELDRIIAASSQSIDRTFTLSVEEIAHPTNRKSPPVAERNRPPKPSLDGALLHVRAPNLFVLERKVGEDQLFVTGCNGRISWAISPDGPVRASRDLKRFNRDVPGHEQAMPLGSLRDGLEQLHAAYALEVLPVESSDEESAPTSEPTRLMIGVKKRGYRGPKRVEITYVAATGHIRQMRFVEMPYGPERITLRMTLVAERQLPEGFYDHESHHDRERFVEYED